MRSYLIAVFILCSQFAKANSPKAPETLTEISSKVILISTSKVEVSTFGSPDFFETALYNHDSEIISFTTANDITTIQIYNEEGTIEFQLPVMSNNVLLNTNLFDKGDYKLGFITEFSNDIYFANVKIK